MAGGGARTGKKKRRGKIRGKKKGKGGEEDEGDVEDGDAQRESVAIVASAREAVAVEPVIAVVESGGLVVSEKLLGVGSHVSTLVLLCSSRRSS